MRSDTGDLSVRFSDHATLEVLNISSGYEAWEISLPGLHVVATGGGGSPATRQRRSATP